ncbi:MAG: tyrosine-protein phosphatase [Bdellovibrionota bacterium]
MKILTLFLALVIATTGALADPTPAPILDGGHDQPSTVPGITIPNTHVVTEDKGMVLRGAQPIGKEKELLKFGITDVLVFKKENKTEVTDELATLVKLGIPKSRLTYVPFRWIELPEFKTACQQTLTALDALRKALLTKSRKAFFHCTYGEDRTGYLAGLLVMLQDGWSVEDAFQKALCEHGYEAGNPEKPDNVVEAIRSEMTQLFLRMAYLIEKGKVRPLVTYPYTLDPKVCLKDPGLTDISFKKDPRFQASHYECKKPE